MSGAEAAASTLVEGMSTVTVDWEAVLAEVAWDWLPAKPAGVAGPEAEGMGKGKGDPGEKAPLSNGLLFCVFIWPIMVFKACCIAYFWKKIKTQMLKLYEKGTKELQG